jgi:hypothetical protein
MRGDPRGDGGHNCQTANYDERDPNSARCEETVLVCTLEDAVEIMRVLWARWRDVQEIGQSQGFDPPVTALFWTAVALLRFVDGAATA